MTDLKSNLNKEWEQISDLLNSLMPENGVIPQIDIDILLSAIRKFYQDVHNINNLTKSSYKTKISELESDIHEMKTIIEDSVRRQEEAKKEIENIKQQNTDKVIDSLFEKKISDLELSIYGIKTTIEDSIKRQEKIEVTIENIEPQRKFIREEITTEEKIGFSPEKENLSESEESISSEESSEDKTGIKAGDIQREEDSSNSETLHDIPGEGKELLNEEIANHVQDIPEITIEETVVQEDNGTVSSDSKEENRQSSLFEYLQANNIEQIKQNVSKFIETRNEVKDESKLAIGERFKQEGPSVIEKITPQTEDRSIGVKIQQQAIRDLRDIIGINEKFLFINELFSGNMREYTDFILHLNSLNSKEDVEIFLQEIQISRNWTETTHAYITLLQIIKRRFF